MWHLLASGWGCHGGRGLGRPARRFKLLPGLFDRGTFNQGLILGFITLSHGRIIAHATKIALIRTDVDHGGHDHNVWQVQADKGRWVADGQARRAESSDNFDIVIFVRKGAYQKQIVVEGDKILGNASLYRQCGIPFGLSISISLLKAIFSSPISTIPLPSST